MRSSSRPTSRPARSRRSASAAPRRVGRLRTDVFSDAVVRVAGGLTVVLNRFLADNVQVLDAEASRRGSSARPGAGSNPHDIVVERRAATKAYVTRYGATRALDRRSGGARLRARFRRGTIDLSPWADADGLPEMDQMALVGARLFVTVQRLDRGARLRADRVEPARRDRHDDRRGHRRDRRSRRGTPFGDASGIVREPGTGELVVSTPGDLYAVGDGGIERVDPVTLDGRRPASSSARTTSAATSPTSSCCRRRRATRSCSGSDLRNALVAFDPSGAVGRAHALHARRASCRTSRSRPTACSGSPTSRCRRYGIRIFDPATDES